MDDAKNPISSGETAAETDAQKDVIETSETTSAAVNTEAAISSPHNPASPQPTTSTIVEEIAQEPAEPETAKQPVTIKLIHNKNKHEHTTDLNNTIAQLKKEIESITGIPSATQKVMYKGSTQDTQTLKGLKVTNGAKFMVIGSTLDDLLKIQKPEASALKSSAAEAAETKSLPLSEQVPHKKILEKYGKPEDIIAGNRSVKLALPTTPLSGFYNARGSKSRLTFKIESDELWLGTKEKTYKWKMGQIKNVVSEAIKDNEDYHIVGIQLGPTEASRMYLYWVPAQFVDSIKDTILGKWQY